MEQAKLSFSSDYMEGTHPAILQRLAETNLEKTGGYGADPYTKSAADKIRRACCCPGAEVFLLVGGTQTNATVIDAVLRPYQGVLAPETGHISVHEAGAIEYGGHKVLALPHTMGKITAEQVAAAVEDYRQDENRDHTVMPGLVYISQPTEYGTLYSRQELSEISRVCQSSGLFLYVDGARLAYALACRENDVTLPDLAQLCDAFYIGGTKCGALFGEAVVFPRRGTVPHFFSMVKQHGALFAKGRILGLQFDTLFTDGLYFRIGDTAIRAANKIRAALKELGYNLPIETPTNQIFVLLSDEQLQKLSGRVEFGFWEKRGAEGSVARIATSWATRTEDVEKLIVILRSCAPLTNHD